MSSQVSKIASRASGASPVHTSQPTRRRLSERQVSTVVGLVAAAEDELREHGFDGLTVRNVARRAGVAPATAYTYFTSKEHLVAEVFWRRLQALDAPRVDRRRTAAGRVTAALTDLALLIADEPELTAAVSVAMLGNDPDVVVLREHIGAAMRSRLIEALGADAHPTVVTTLEMVMTGTLLRAGMGYLSYADLPELLADMVDVVLGGN